MSTITYLDLIRVWCSRCNRSQLLRRSEGQEVVSCPWRCHACGHDNLDPVSGSMKEDQSCRSTPLSCLTLKKWSSTVSKVPDVEIVIVSGDMDWEGWYVNGELVFEDTYITPGDTLETLRRLYPDGFRITKVKEVEYDTGWFYRKDYCNLPQKLEDVVVEKGEEL